jgi:hypothetical protein
MVKNDGVQFVGVMPLSDLSSGKAINILLLGLWIVFKLPNVQQLFHQYKPALAAGHFQPIGWLANRCLWQHKPIYAWLVGALFVYTLISFTKTSEFLYFRF